jgi:HSP20 family protein
MMISDMLRFPFSMLDDDLERLFAPGFVARNSSVSRVNYPPVNIATTDKSVEVYLFVAGMDPDDLELVIEKNMLSIAGERKLPEVTGEKAVNYRQERFEGQFKRTISLPGSVDPESASAAYKEGVLHISIEKRAESQPRQVKVSVQ